MCARFAHFHCVVPVVFSVPVLLVVPSLLLKNQEVLFVQHQIYMSLNLCKY